MDCMTLLILSAIGAFMIGIFLLILYIFSPDIEEVLNSMEEPDPERARVEGIERVARLNR